MNLYLSDGKAKMWRKTGTANDPKHTASSVKNGGGGVITWACMAASGTGPLNFTDDLMYDASSRMNLEGYKTILPPDSLGSASYCIRTMTQNTLPVQSVRLVSYSSFNHICKCRDPTANRAILSLLLQYLWRVLYMYIYIYIYIYIYTHTHTHIRDVHFNRLTDQWEL